MQTGPGPCHFVIFGATGHLATTKLLPALYRLDAAERLGEDLRFIAFARRDWRLEDWLQHLELVLQEHTGRAFDRAVYDRFARRFVHAYPAGTWGPEEANRLFDREDHAWRNDA